MKINQRVKRSRILIISGIQLVLVCLIVIVVASLFNMVWLMETAGIVAILVAIFTFVEYWNMKRFKLKKR